MGKREEEVSIEIVKLVDAVVDEFVGPLYSSRWASMSTTERMEWCKEFARKHAVWTYSDGELCEVQPESEPNHERKKYSRDRFDDSLDKLDRIIKDYNLVEDTCKQVLSNKDHESKLVVSIKEPLSTTTVGLDTDMLSKLLCNIEQQYFSNAVALCDDMRSMINDLLSRRLSSCQE